MTISLDKAIGIQGKALVTFGQRAEVLANNIANADTPEFKSRDIDFKSALKESHFQQRASLAQTNAKHFRVNEQKPQFELNYREPLQTKLDGNTVDMQMETAAFSENSIRYQAALSFLSGRFKGILTALKGE